MTGANVAVIGATGAVGSHVLALLDLQSTRVIAVSRSAERARTVAAPLRAAIGLSGDWADPGSLGAEVPGVVINCTGIEDVRLIRRWRRAGWAVIDITASSGYARELVGEPLGGPPLLVGVGLSPGLTSVLAKDLLHGEPGATALSISCLVGLNEDYGDASRSWTLGRLGRRVVDDSGGFRNFSDPRVVAFPGGFGHRPAWRFDFADRVLLPAPLGVSVTTRYCFDSRGAGRALAIAGAMPLAPRLLTRMGRLTRRAAGGTAWWAGVVETDTGGRAWALGHGQSFGTAAVTAIAADRLLGAVPPGARLLWDVIEGSELAARLAGHGILVGRDA